MRKHGKQINVIRELMNIGVENVAHHLSNLFSFPILLQIPSIKINAGNCLADNSYVIPRKEYFSCITMNFTGDIQGRSHLIMKKNNVLRLSKNILHVSVETPGFDRMMTGTMTDIGTILINSIVGSISNIFHYYVDFSLPDYFEGTGEIVTHWNAPSKKQMQLEAYTLFTLETLNIDSYVFVYIELRHFKNMSKTLLNVIL